MTDIFTLVPLPLRPQAYLHMNRFTASHWSEGLQLRLKWALFNTLWPNWRVLSLRQITIAILVFGPVKWPLATIQCPFYSYSNSVVLLRKPEDIIQWRLTSGHNLSAVHLGKQSRPEWCDAIMSITRSKAMHPASHISQTWSASRQNSNGISNGCLI